ncbi:MAG: hypothetical protein AAFW81_06120 [Pseudomonadota bacterium]
MLIEYLHLPAQTEPPSSPIERPFASVVIIEMDVTDEWRDKISHWLVKNGCLYMMAWGNECSLWDDSVDWAILGEFDFGDVPGENYVVTTWHNDELLEEVFWFSHHCARHEYLDMRRFLLLDISLNSRKTTIIKQFISSYHLHDTQPE